MKGLFGSKRSQSIPSDLTSLPSDLNRKEGVSIEPSSLELGVAAGYTSHFIKEIESSLNRIETQMLTKDWFSVKLDESVGKRLLEVQNSLEALLESLKVVPEPHRTHLTSEIKRIQAQIPLSSKMSELLQTIKAAGSISYDDLAAELKITVPALRGLLSETLKRTDSVERFRKANKGWVQYKGAAENDFQALQSALNPENGLRKRFEEVAATLGLKIEHRFYQTSPDFLVSKDGDQIAVEIKAKSDASSLEKGLGQLIYAKEQLLPKELWFVIPAPPSADWLRILQASKIRVFVLSDKGFNEQQTEDADKLSSQINLFFGQESQNKANFSDL